MTLKEKIKIIIADREKLLKKQKIFDREGDNYSRSTELRALMYANENYIKELKEALKGEE